MELGRLLGTGGVPATIGPRQNLGSGPRFRRGQGSAACQTRGRSRRCRRAQHSLLITSFTLQSRIQVAISYIRFSSAQQSEGDSLRRQLEMTRTYAATYSLLLDESLTYRDLGVSGWKGKNRTEGMLKALLDGIKAGRVRPGTALLVERLDRLTREGFMTGVTLMMDILKAGIEVHSVASGRIFCMPNCDRGIRYCN
jgi:hypothetical protein